MQCPTRDPLRVLRDVATVGERRCGRRDYAGRSQGRAQHRRGTDAALRTAAE